MSIVLYLFSCFFFFFQAEDGIRDLTVTGVQTCALPIYLGVRRGMFNFDRITYKIYRDNVAQTEAFKAGEFDFLRVDRKSTRLNSSHSQISYAVFCLKKKKKHEPANPL